MEFVTKLGMEMYLPGENILMPGKKVNVLRIICKGSCNLWGLDESTNIEYKICKLPRKSWYGDFNVFLNLKTVFRLQAYKPSRKRSIKKSERFDDGKIHMYTIEG